MARLLVICCLAGLLRGATASQGDRDGAFQSCVSSCQAEGCVRLPVDKQAKLGSNSIACDAACPERNGLEVPWALQAMRWSCADDCKYRCMHLREYFKQRIYRRQARPLDKYFGKWPFRRVWGVQELMSVLFSICNLVAQLHCLGKVVLAAVRDWRATRSSSNRLSYAYWPLWILYGAVSINAWLWSVVFHARDTPRTERLDYMSADADVALALFISAMRTTEQPAHLWFVWAAPMCLLLSCHVYYMLYVLFDYGLNMKLCLGAGILQMALWCWFVHRRQHQHRNKLYAFVMLMNSALLLEVLDFRPIKGLLDAHAVWHACTIPLTYLWYEFVFADAEWVRMSARVASPSKKIHAR